MPDIMSAEEVLRRLKEKKRIYDFPRASERTFWDSLPREKKELLMTHVETALNDEIPLLKAKDYMKFFRNGNRVDFEGPFFRRRHHLAALVLGECVEYQGRLLDDIIEILWQILAEPTWCLPAHQHLADWPLPGPEEWVVDLFAAETAKILTDVLQLLGPELEKTCLPIVQRIRYEVSHRVLDECEKKDFMWYTMLNNWSVWCCFSVISAAVELWQDDLERLAPFISRHMVPIKNFMDNYPEDGGCNEGPSYWVVAVGMLMNGLEILQRRLGGMEPWLEDPKLKNMVEFIPRMNLGGKWFMGFSDAESTFFKLPRGLFVKYANMVKSDLMRSIAVTLPEPELTFPGLGNRNTGCIFDDIANLTEDLSARGPHIHDPVDFWPDLQIWIARQKPRAPEEGMVCCLKGGHNRQSHNHMDLGHFSLFHKNTPIIIDVGRGTYSRTCFSRDRYTLWNLNAEGHNAARFDNMPQGLGREYETAMENQGDRVICDITKAFLAENGIKSYIRDLSFDREKGVVELEEEASFEGKKEIIISFYTPVEPKEADGGTLLLNDIRLSCEGIELARPVSVDYADEKLIRVWGALWRIDLKCTAVDNASWKIRFSAES